MAPTRLPVRTHRRFRPMAAALALVAVAATASAQLATADEPSGTANPAAAAPTNVPPVPQVESAVHLADGPRYATDPEGTVYSPLNNNPDVIGGHDNGQSALYDNGKGLRFSMWTFGDTALKRSNGDGDNWLAHSGARTYDLDMSDNNSDWTYEGGPDGPREFIDLTPEEQAFNEAHLDTDPDQEGCQPGPGIPAEECGDEYAIWGAGVVADPENERILAFYSEIIRHRNATWTAIGIGMAQWTESTGEWERKTIKNPADPSLPTILWPHGPNESLPIFDKAPVVSGGYLYKYGCYTLQPSETFYPECRLARVSMKDPDAVVDRNAWRFFSGHDRDRADCPALWSHEVDCAALVPAEGTHPDGAPRSFTGGAAGTSVFQVPALDNIFMAVYSVPLSDDLHYSVAYRPEGPWSEPQLLGTALPGVGEGLGAFAYAGFAHPEFSEQDGLVQYVTYHHVTGFLQSDHPVLKVTFAQP